MSDPAIPLEAVSMLTCVSDVEPVSIIDKSHHTRQDGSACVCVGGGEGGRQHNHEQARRVRTLIQRHVVVLTFTLVLNSFDWRGEVEPHNDGHSSNAVQQFNTVQKGMYSD